MHVTGATRILNCEYCGAQNTVPQDIWDQFAPKAPPRPASPYGGPPPPVGQTLPLPPRRTGSNKAIIMIFVAFFAITALGIVVPILFGFCTACVALFGGVAATSQSQSQQVPAIESPLPSALTIESKGSGFSFSKFVSSDAVTPSFEQADAQATAESVFDAVRANWNADAVLGQAVLSKVKSDGTVDLGAGGGSMILTFYVPPGSVAGTGTIEDGRLIVTAANSMVVAVLGSASSSEIESAQLLAGMPPCTIKELWKEARKEGYSESGEANILFPHLPPILSAKEKKKEKDYYAYIFNTTGGKAGKATYFLLKDCRAR